MLTTTPTQTTHIHTTTTTAPCKNHPSVPSGYFAADQPWAKYCRECALNVALSGRKIQKELSGVQFQQKMRIGSAAAELRSSLAVIEQSSEHYRRLAERAEETASQLQTHLRQVETALKQLTLAKEQLEGLYSRELVERVQVYYEKQSHAAMLSLQVKRELEAIQSNFGTLIEAQEEQFNQQQSKWDTLLDSFKQDSLSQEDYRENQAKIVSSIEEFFTQLEKIAYFRIDLKLERPHGQDELDMTLTPIDGNSLAETVTFEQLKLSMKPRGQLKLKTHKKLGQSYSSSKACTKRSSLCDHQTIRRA